MDKIKEAFQKIKQEMFILNREIFSLKKNLNELNFKIEKIYENIDNISVQKVEILSENIQTNKVKKHTDASFQPTDEYNFKAFNNEEKEFSTGNNGVQTNRQTDKQTNRQTDKTFNAEEVSLNNVLNVVESLDSLKKEIRLKFKRLTDQELVVFSAIYQSEEENNYSDYKSLSEKLKLSESAIRDYVRKLVLKGVPITKIKIRNKKVNLSISKNLKKIASLSTIIQLRDI